MIDLMEHQRGAVHLARSRPRFYLGWEPGLGKTCATVSIVADGKARNFDGSTLVLAPKSILRTAWEADAAKFAPGLKTVVAWDASAAKRRRLIETPGVDLFVSTYETAKKHFEDFYRVGVRRLVIDEASKCKAPDTQITKACQRFASRIPSVYLLSGTPAPNGAHEWIPQLQIIDPGLFGGGYWRAMYAYFTPLKRLIDGKERIVGWKPIEAKREEFLARVASVSWSLRKVDCLDLPPQTDVIREVSLSASEATAYRSMFNDLRVEFTDGATLTAAVQSRLMKLRQITGGLIYGPCGPTPIGRSKLDEMMEVMEEIGDRPSVVWCEFTAEIDRVTQELRKAGRKVGRLDGQVPMEQRAATIRSFQDGGLDNVVCHPAAAGHGVTLTRAAYAIYFSHSYSFEQYQQSRDRIHRVGQTRNTTYYHLIAKGTVDENVWRALGGKQTVHEAVMELLGGGGVRAVA